MGVKKKKSQINRLETFATRLSEHSALGRSDRKRRARRRGNDASGTLGFSSTICLQRPDVAPLNLSELRAEHFHPSGIPTASRKTCAASPHGLFVHLSRCRAGLAPACLCQSVVTTAAAPAPPPPLLPCAFFLGCNLFFH